MSIATSFVSYLSRHYCKLYPKSIFVGVAGDWGRQEAITLSSLILSKKYPVLIATPTSMLKMTPRIKKVILEVNGGYNLTPPATLIINSASTDSREIVDLVSKMDERSLLILNYDDINVRRLSEVTSAQVVFYGTDKENCLVRAENIQIEDFFTSFEINYGVERVKIDSPLLSEYQIYPILAASCLGLMEGVSLTTIKNALKQIEPIEHQLQPVLGYNNSVILDDTLSSDPMLIEGSIDTLMKIPARRHILVLSEIKDLGRQAEAVHRKIAQKIFREKVDLVFLGIGEANFVADELKRLGFVRERMEDNLQNPQIVSKLLKVLMKGDILLILGGLSSRFDEIVKRVSKKS